MTPMKMKNNFCDRRQYEMEKSQDGEGKDGYKILQPDGGGKHSKHNILCGTVHDYHENEK